MPVVTSCAVAGNRRSQGSFYCFGRDCVEELEELNPEPPSRTPSHLWNGEVGRGGNFSATCPASCLGLSQSPSSLHVDFRALCLETHAQDRKLSTWGLGSPFLGFQEPPVSLAGWAWTLGKAAGWPELTALGVCSGCGLTLISNVETQHFHRHPACRAPIHEDPDETLESNVPCGQ